MEATPMLAVTSVSALSQGVPLEALLFPVSMKLFEEPSSRVVSPAPKRFYWGPFPTNRLDRGLREPSVSLIGYFAPIAVKRPTPVPARRSDGLGIDLEKRGLEVRKLFYAAFARGLVKDGYDPEEALQEVYRGLLARNKGTCPFNVEKSSFGHYVHIVARCVLANYIRKEKRRTMHESTESSLGSGTEGGFAIDGCPDVRNTRVPDPGSLERLSRSIGGGIQVESALRLLSEGYSRREVVAELGVEAKWLDGILATAKATLTR